MKRTLSGATMWTEERKAKIKQAGEAFTFKEIMNEYMSRSSTHGIPNIWSSKTIPRRVLWLFFSLAAVSMLVFQIQSLVTRYYSYPTNVIVKADYNVIAQFPAVTVCNLNPVKQSALHYIDPDQAEYMDTRTMKTKLVTIQTINSTSLTREQTGSGDGEGDDYDEEDGDGIWQSIMDSEDFFSSSDPEYLLRHELLLGRQQANTSDISVLGHKLGDMMFACTFNGQQCGPANFTEFYNSQFGNCYAFNSDMKRVSQSSRPSVTVRKPGIQGGLELQMFIEVEEYVPILSPSAGIKVLIHQNDRMPFPEESGIPVAPGTAAEIGLKRVVITRQPLPYDGTDCMMDYKHDSETSYKINLYQETHGMLYSSQACSRTCYQVKLYEKCGCVDPEIEYKNLAALGKVQDPQLCDLYNSTFDSCENRISIDFHDGKLQCDCPLPCSETQYIERVATSKWPAEAYEDVLMHRLSTFGPPFDKIFKKLDDGDADIDDNLLKINVFFEEMSFQRITEEPAYTDKDLLSDLGGQLGLWMGMSILALAEIIEFVADMILRLCKKKVSPAPENEIKTPPSY